MLSTGTMAMRAGDQYRATAQASAPYRGYTLALVPLTWPTSGDVLRVQIERDTGEGWKFEYGCTLGAPQPTVDRSGKPLAAVTRSVHYGSVGAASHRSSDTDRYRLTIHCLQACMFSLSLTGDP